MKLWKLKRELKRLVEQVGGAISAIWEPWAQSSYERQRSLLVQRWVGSIQPDSQHARVVVYLLFQPSGLSESTFQACEYLNRKGFAPLVVSNAPLFKADVDRLRTMTWQIIQRPNYGYDFGGYREGLWWLKELGCVPAELILVNDSIWFPFPVSSDPVDLVTREKAAMVGLLSAEDKRSSIQSGTARPPFICSFFIYFRTEVITHPAFRLFWENYRYTNSKHKTIRRGERGLTYALRAAGVECRSVMNRLRFDQWLEALAPSEIATALTFLVLHDERLKLKTSSLMSRPVRDDRWIREARALLLEATEGQNYPSLLPYLFFTEHGCGYFKKALDPINAQAICKIVTKAEISNSAIKQELVHRLRARG